MGARATRCFCSSAAPEASPQEVSSQIQPSPAQPEAAHEKRASFSKKDSERVLLDVAIPADYPFSPKEKHELICKHQVQLEIKRVIEMAEKRGCAKLVQELLEESKVEHGLITIMTGKDFTIIGMTPSECGAHTDVLKGEVEKDDFDVKRDYEVWALAAERERILLNQSLQGRSRARSSSETSSVWPAFHVPEPTYSFVSSSTSSESSTGP